jgi:hypothetical protein
MGRRPEPAAPCREGGEVSAGKPRARPPPALHGLAPSVIRVPGAPVPMAASDTNSAPIHLFHTISDMDYGFAYSASQ